MEQTQGWAEEIAARMGREVRAARDRAGLTASELSDKTRALGYPIHRVAIAKIETGKRGTKFDPAELIIIAKALGVPPLQLIYPGQPGDEIDVLPQYDAVPTATTSIAAALWFSGEAPTQYLVTTPEGTRELTYNGNDLEDHVVGGRPLNLAREEVRRLEALEAAEAHFRELSEEHKIMEARIDRVRTQLDTAVDDESKDPLEQQLDYLKARQDPIGRQLDYAMGAVSDQRRRVAEIRQQQRDAGLNPAPLPTRYAAIDRQP